MTDIVDLGMRVDTRDLDRGKGKVDQFGGAVKGAEAATAAAAMSMKRSFLLVSAGVTAALGAVAGLGSSIRVIGDFETAVSGIAAVTGATAAEMEQMRAVAKDLGSTTEFTAAQAADGLRFLGMAGFQASESIAAIPAVLDLATAAEMGLAEAADIASNIMSAFGIAASDAAAVTDVLAAAASRTNTDVFQLGDAMKYVGPVAAAMGISVEKAAAAAGVLSDAGIQGSMAGTGLRQVLSSLANPTGEAAKRIEAMGIALADVNPVTNELTDIIDRFAQVNLSAADALTIFGDRGAPAVLSLVSMNDSLRETTEGLQNVEGAASNMANIMRDNLTGDINGLKSAAEGLIIAMGEAGLTAAIRFVVQGMTDLVRGITTVVDAFRPGEAIFNAVAIALAGLAASTIPALMTSLATLATSFSVAAAASGVLAGAMTALRVAVAALGGPLGILYALTGAAAAAMVLFSTDTGTAETAMYDAEAGTNALNAQLGVFASTAAPAAGAAAIALANDNKVLAASAFEAAQAELAKRQAMLQSAQAQYAVDATDPEAALIMGAQMSQAQVAVNQQIAQVESARRALEQARNDANRAADTVSGSSYGGAGTLPTTITPPTIDTTGVGTGGGTGGGSGVSAANEAQQEALRESQRLFDATRTSAENYAAELEDLNALHQQGLIDTETYNRALDQLEQKYKSAGEAGRFFEQQAMKITDSLVDIAFEGGNIIDVMRDVAKSIAKAALQAALFGQGPMAGLFGQIPGAGLLSGLFKFSTGTNNAPGGLSLVGEQGPELVNLPKGSMVTPSERTNQLLSSVSRDQPKMEVKNNIINVLDPSLVGQYLTTAEGERAVVNIMQRNS